MSKYINADTMAEYIEKYYFYQTEINELAIFINDLWHAIDKMPSADVVEIVRCKDCRRYAIDNKGEQYCPFTRGLRKPKPDDFCSYGERKDK